jgi:hypothetical protein
LGQFRQLTANYLGLFAVLVQEVNQAKRAAAPRFRTSKSPNKSPLNYLSIAQIGSNLLQKSANLSGFSAGDATYTTRRRRLAPPQSADSQRAGLLWPLGQKTMVLSTASEFVSDFLFKEWDKMRVKQDVRID